MGMDFRTGYNFLRDSMKLDHFNLYFRTTLFEKISITANTVWILIRPINMVWTLINMPGRAANSNWEGLHTEVFR